MSDKAFLKQIEMSIESKYLATFNILKTNDVAIQYLKEVIAKVDDIIKCFPIMGIQTYTLHNTQIVFPEGADISYIVIKISL